MNEDYTHISVILDRTGSMQPIRDDTIGGFNAFLQEQREETTGTATLTLVQFDSKDPYEVIHQFELIQTIPKLTRQTYVPRANTPLLDAIGRGINDLEERLGKMETAQRPAQVVFVIITDGQENASREFRKEDIVKMIEQKQEEDNWQFVFLSADLDSMNDALSYGFAQRASMSYDKTTTGTQKVWRSLSQNVRDYRQKKNRSLSFSDEDRAQQESESKRKSRRRRRNPKKK